MSKRYSNCTTCGILLRKIKLARHSRKSGICYKCGDPRIGKSKKKKHLKCRGVTKKGIRCQKNAVKNGWCQIHNPNGKFRQYVKEERARRESIGGKYHYPNEKKVRKSQDNKEAYYNYIKTDLWKQKASDCKSKYGNKCAVCNSPEKIAAHHRTYKNIFDEKPGDLICLCGDCHSKFHEVGKYEVNYGK